MHVPRLNMFLIVFSVVAASSSLASNLGRFDLKQLDLGLTLTLADDVEASRIPRNKMVSLLVTFDANQACNGKSPVLEGFDARMPEHRHGMVVKPKISPVSKHSFRIDGVKLHMSGHWQLDFNIRCGAVTELLSTSIKIN